MSKIIREMNLVDRKTSENRVRISDHADEEAEADRLTFDEIYFSVLHGEVIENYPTDKPYPSRRFEEIRAKLERQRTSDFKLPGQSFQVK